MNRLNAFVGVAVVLVLSAGAFAFLAPPPTEAPDEAPSNVTVGDGTPASDVNESALNGSVNRTGNTSGEVNGTVVENTTISNQTEASNSS